MSGNASRALVVFACLGLAVGCRTRPEQVSKPAEGESGAVLRSAVQITKGADKEGFPHVSVDGETIALVRTQKGTASIFTQAVGESQQTKQFSIHGANEFGACWHRHPKTGKEMIAFASDRTPTTTIWERDPSGVGAQRQIVADDPSCHYYEPDVNPVNGKLAFVRSKGAIDQANPLATLEYGSDSFVMVCSHEGSDLTEFVSGVNPRWSPDGKRLAFARRGLGGTYDLWVVDANGGNLTQLTFHPGNEIEPCWSPDGTRIAYAAEKGGDTRRRLFAAHTPDFDIWVMRADAANPAQLTATKTFEGRPAYAPNGDIYFHSYEFKRFGKSRLTVMRVTPNLPPEN